MHIDPLKPETWSTKHREAKRIRTLADDAIWNGDAEKAESLYEQSARMLSEPDEAIPPF